MRVSRLASRARPARRLGVLPPLALVFVAASAASQPVSGARAGDHFREAMLLFRRGEVGPACRTFELSYAEDGAPGTLFNMAVCHEREGRVADAYRELETLASRAEAAGHPDKARGLEARAAAMRPKLARIDLRQRSDAHTDVTGVTVDGAPLLADSWQKPLFVAPGAHAIRVRLADGTQVTRTTGALAAGSVTDVQLEDAPPAAPLPVGSVTTSPPAADVSTAGRGKVIAGWVTGAAGLGLAGVATYFGVRTFSDRSAGTTLCPGGTCATADARQTAYDDRHDAKVDATLSTVFFVAGGLAVATGVYLVISGRARSAASASAEPALRLSPATDGHGAGAQMGGVF